MRPLRSGDDVTIFGLTNRVDLNGQQGKLDHDADTAAAGRWAVVLDSGGTVSVRETNLVDAADYDTDEEWIAARVAKRQRALERPTASLQRTRHSPPSSSHLPTGFLLPEPPPPPADFMLAKEAARAKAKGARGPGHSRMSGWGQREHNALLHQCSLAEPYEADLDDWRLASEMWVATEKFDGCRAVWDPTHVDGAGFRSRSGSRFVPPASFAALLPPDMQLDGELWAGRRNFANVGRLVGSRSVDSGRWHAIAWQSLTYVVFDAPLAGDGSLGYLDRLDLARRRLAAMASDRVLLVPTVPLANVAAKDDLLRRVIEAGGEGLVLRRAAARWRAGSSKSRDVLKVKDWLDAEAVVLDNRPAPSSSNLPTVVCRILNAPRADTSGSFELSRTRDSPQLPPGTIITFLYRQISQATGQPSVAGGAPRIHRVHDPSTCDCCFCSPGARATL